jgi:hypothetical protein
MLMLSSGSVLCTIESAQIAAESPVHEHLVAKLTAPDFLAVRSALSRQGARRRLTGGRLAATRHQDPRITRRASPTAPSTPSIGRHRRIGWIFTRREKNMIEEAQGRRIGDAASATPWHGHDDRYL